MLKRLYNFLFGQKKKQKCKTKNLLHSEKERVKSEALSHLKEIREAIADKQVA